MRPRRRFDQARPVQDQTRINEAIRASKVRLVDEDGSQVGLKTRDEALEYAYSKDLDLVEVASGADPPVARIMDYGKYKYEQEQKAKTARKHQSQIHVKEIKMRPKIGVHDYETKKGHVVRFLNARAKVKVTIMFRGREQSHPERGRDRLVLTERPLLLRRLVPEEVALPRLPARQLPRSRHLELLLRSRACLHFLHLV